MSREESAHKKSKKKRKREKPVESEEDQQWEQLCTALNLDGCSLAEFRALTEDDLTEFLSSVPPLKRGKLRLMYKANAVPTKRAAPVEETEEVEEQQAEEEAVEQEVEQEPQEEVEVEEKEEEQIERPNPVSNDEAQKPKKKKKKKEQEAEPEQRHVNTSEPKSSKKNKNTETHTGHDRHPTQSTPKASNKSASSSSSSPSSPSSPASFKNAKNSVIPQAEGKMITVSFKVLNPNEPRALLCCFPAGDPLEGSTVLLHNAKSEKKKNQRIVKYEAMGVDFYGKNFGSENNSSENGLAYAIGDAQRSEHGIEVSLIPVVDNTVFSMTPVVPEEEEEAKASNQMTDFNTKRMMLAETYGSVKRQRMLRQTISNQYDITKDTESQAVMAAALQTAKAMGSGMAKLEFTTLPPHDDETDDVSKIYDINSIIPREVWDSIDIGPMLSLLSKMDKNDTASEMATHRMSALVTRAFQKLSGTKPADRPPLVRCTMLLDYLIRFLLMPLPKKAMTLTSCTTMPDAVKTYLLKNFTERLVKGDVVKEDNVTDNLQDKLRCLICILALTVMKFTLGAEDIKALSTDLRTDTRQLAAYFTQVGCRGATPNKATLKAPLRLPELKTKGKKRK